MRGSRNTAALTRAKQRAHDQTQDSDEVPDGGNQRRTVETGEQLLAYILEERRRNWQGRGQYKDPVAPDSSNLPPLPRRWTWATLDTLADVKGGITKDQNRKHSAPARSVPYLRVANVQRGYLDLSEIKEIVATEDVIQELLLKPGDILFNEGGDRDKLGRGWVWNAELPECIHQNHVFRARRFSEALNPKLVSWYANTVGQQFFFDEGKHTTNLASISMTKLKTLPVPVAPPDEATRIVAEIEKQFTRLDAGVAALKRAQANLKRYRAAVLKAACEGRLVPTEAELARSGERKGKFESGEQLLARILDERRKNWRGRGKYREPVAVDTSNLPTIPDGWVWATLDSLIREPLRNGHSAKATGTEFGLRVFTLSAITEGDFSERNTKLSVATPEKVDGLWSEPGDIYVERSNTPELVGICRHYKGPRHFAFIPDLFIRVRLAPPILATYIETCLLSERGRGFFRSRAQGIAGTMPKIDQETVEAAPIPLPPVVEQTRIVAEVERRLSVVEELEAVVTANLQRAARLRQAVLQKAFTGGLV